MVLQLELNDQSQIEAIRAFLKALKIKHTIKEDGSKMSKEAYFEMLDASINDAKNGKSKKLNKELKKALFA